MKKGLGFFGALLLVCGFLKQTFAETTDLTQELNRLRGQEVSVAEEVQAIEDLLARTDEFNVREAMTLLRQLGEELREIRPRLEHSNDNEEQRALRASAREILRKTIVIILKTPIWAGRINEWLDKNRKTYFFLSEVFVVAAAIYGAELAFHAERSIGMSFLYTFGLALAPAALVVFPSRLILRQSFHRRFMSFFGLLLSNRRASQEELFSLASELAYPSNLLSCSELLTLIHGRSRLKAPGP